MNAPPATSAQSALPSAAVVDTRTHWFGHPRGLTILFLTEMWEKFSYFGMRALLIYYMTKALAIPQEQASWIYGGYTAFTYFTPIIGGLIADRWLGRRNAVVAGGSIMALGHFMMAFEGLFYPALATIALGNGLFLPSLPSQIQTLYRPEDPRRNSAYSVYYVGVNLGAVIAPLICGTLGELFGWHWGFGAAGIGMCVGLAIYVLGGRYLPAAGIEASPGASTAPGDTGSFMSRLVVLLGVVAIIVVFRGAYEQTGNTVALWADAAVDRGLGSSWTIPSTWFQALNPLLVFALTPVLLVIWRRQAEAGQPFAPLRRMALGALIVAGAYALLALASQLAAGAGQPAHWLWLTVFFLVYTTGELCILPTGLALFGRLAPGALAATTIALWFSASFAGNLLAGAIGSLWSRFAAPGFFTLITAIAAAAAALNFPQRSHHLMHRRRSSPRKVRRCRCHSTPGAIATTGMAP
jgi:proton-dependent oligopeptide transporter, POT family